MKTTLLTAFALLVSVGLAVATPRASTYANDVTLHKKPGKKMDTVKSKTGLEYIDIKKGKGPSPKKGQTIVVNYTGKLTDGKTFDSNVDPAFHHVEPFSTAIGVGQVIPGWDEGMMSMKVGGKRRLIIPPQLGYGARGAGAAIPPNATLIFDVELLSIK